MSDKKNEIDYLKNELNGILGQANVAIRVYELVNKINKLSSKEDDNKETKEV